jgi:hypothetical protein
MILKINKIFYYFKNNKMETSVIEILKTIPTTFSINDELINSLNSNYIKINSVWTSIIDIPCICPIIVRRLAC